MNLPRRFGRYELLDHLATGGMAEVFRARSFGVEGFERQVCIKRILPGLSRDPRFVANNCTACHAAGNFFVAAPMKMQRQPTCRVPTCRVPTCRVPTCHVPTCRADVAPA